MNQLLKIAFDNPDKIEKIFLWIVQTLIILWLSPLILNGVINSNFSHSKDAFLDLFFLQKLSPINLACYLLIFALSWILIWHVFADLIINLIFLLLNGLVRIITKIIVFVLRIIYYSLRFCLYKVRIGNSPRKFWVKSDTEYIDNYPQKSKVNEEIEFFYFINRLTKSAFGSQMLLTILTYEKANFINSRIIRYYTIILIVFLAKSNIHNITHNGYVKISILILLILLGFFVFSINDLYTTITKNKLYFLKPMLEFDIYKQMITDALQHSPLSEFYVIENKRRNIILNLKKSDELEILTKDHFEKIIFVPIKPKANNYSKWLLSLEKMRNTLVVFVSEELPDITVLNEIEFKKCCYIYAKKKFDIIGAIYEINPIIIGSVKL